MAYGPLPPVGGTGTQAALHATGGSAPSGSPSSVAPPPSGSASTATFAKAPSVGWTDAPDAATSPGSPGASPSPGGVPSGRLELPAAEVASAAMSLLSPAGSNPHTLAHATRVTAAAPWPAAARTGRAPNTTVPSAAVCPR